MATILDNQRAQLDALILLAQEEIEAIEAQAQKQMQLIHAAMLTDVKKHAEKLQRLREQLHELEDYEPAVDPGDADE